MKNIKSIDCLTEFENLDLTIDYRILKKPLFHGTNSYILNCSKESRNEMMSSCKNIIKFMNELFWSPRYGELEEYASKSKNPFIRSSVLSEFGRSTLYEYGDMYFTGNYISAFNFAKLPCGELITHSYYVAKAIKDLKLDNDDGSVQLCADYVLNNYDEFASGESIILIIKDVEFADIQSERGEAFIWEKPVDMAEKEYIDYIRSDIEDAYRPSVTDDIQHNDNYRINNIEKYNIYAISENMFKEGLSIFTNITNVEKTFDELIRKHEK